MTDTSRQRRAQTDRTRRYRARQRADIQVLTIAVRGHELAEMLLLGGYLTPGQAIYRGEVQRAASEYLADAWRRWKDAEKL